MKKLTAIVPTGGPGGGMYPLTAGMPKSLIPIGSKPMLVHILKNFDPEIFGKIIIVADKYFLMVRNYINAFKYQIPIPIVYKKLSVPPPQQLLELKDELSDIFAIHYTDIITGKLNWKLGYQKYINLKGEDDKTSGLLYLSRNYPLAIGIVRQNLKNPDYIEEFIEKPGKIMKNFVNMAIAIFDRDFIDDIKKSDVSLFGESVPSSMRKGRKFTFLEHKSWNHYQRIGEWVNNQTKFYSK